MQNDSTTLSDYIQPQLYEEADPTEADSAADGMAVREEALRDEVIAVLCKSPAPLDKATIQQRVTCRKQTLIGVLDAAVADGVINEVKNARKTLYTV